MNFICIGLKKKFNCVRFDLTKKGLIPHIYFQKASCKGLGVNNTGALVKRLLKSQLVGMTRMNLKGVPN